MTLTPITEDTLPAVFSPPHRQDTDSWVNVVSDVVRLAQQIAGTDFVPKGIRNSVPATAAAMLYGREVGLPPMTALTSIHVVDGRPGMSAEGMRALVFAAGHEIVFDEATGAICRMRARRSGSTDWTALSWSLDMARAAGLLGRDNWRKYPRAMLIARCTTDLCRMVFPDVIHGFRSTEEIVDMGEGAEVEVPVAPRSTGRTVSRAASKRSDRRPRPVEDTDLPELPPSPPLPGEEVDPHKPDAGPKGPTRGPAEGSGGGVPSDSTPPPDGTSVGDRPDGSVVSHPPEAAPSGSDDDPGPRLANRASIRMIVIQFKRLGLTESGPDRAERLALTSAIVGREVNTTAQLTADEADRVNATVSSVRTADDLRALLAANEAAAAAFADDPLPDPEETDAPLDDEEDRS